MPVSRPLTLLPETEWRALQAAHEARVRLWTDPHQLRAAKGEKHPVYDFLLDTPPDRGCRVQKPWASPRLSYTPAVFTVGRFSVLGVQSSSCHISSCH